LSEPLECKSLRKDPALRLDGLLLLAVPDLLAVQIQRWRWMPLMA
jgi:hypothetical protein